MTSVLVAASAYGADLVRRLGHAHLVPIVAAAGAAGLEIRSELFVGEQDLDALRELLKKHGLFSVYFGAHRVVRCRWANWPVRRWSKRWHRRISCSHAI